MHESASQLVPQNSASTYGLLVRPQLPGLWRLAKWASLHLLQKSQWGSQSQKTKKQTGKGQSRQRWRRRVGLQVLFWRFELTVLGWAQAHRAPLIVLSMVSLGCMKLYIISSGRALIWWPHLCQPILIEAWAYRGAKRHGTKDHMRHAYCTARTLCCHMLPCVP